MHAGEFLWLFCRVSNYNLVVPQYPNTCVLKANAKCGVKGLKVASKGECPEEPKCEPKACTMDWAPVCGNDGKVRAEILPLLVINIAVNGIYPIQGTHAANYPCWSQCSLCRHSQTYGNMCALEAAQCESPGLTKASDGECPKKECGPKVCTADYRPVCGSDGQVHRATLLPWSACDLYTKAHVIEQLDEVMLLLINNSPFTDIRQPLRLGGCPVRKPRPDEGERRRVPHQLIGALYCSLSIIYECPLSLCTIVDKAKRRRPIPASECNQLCILRSVIIRKEAQDPHINQCMS
jgi:hypothetical protein